MRKLLPLWLISALLIFPVATAATVAGHGVSVAADLLDKADADFNNRDWKASVAAYEALCTENPYNGHFWFRLGSSRYGLKEYEAAVAAYERSAQLGFHRGTSLYNVACSYALAGESSKAIDALELAIRSGLQNRERLIREDTDFDSIRDTEAFRERILPAVGPNTDRVSGWRMDLDYLTRRMEETHYDVYHDLSREEWHDAIGQLKRDVRNLKDYQVIVKLMQLVARVNDGHTRVAVPVDGSFHVLPMWFYIFTDGVYIRSAVADHSDLVGSRVVRIGDVPVDEALERVATVTQRDNDQQIKWLAPHYMRTTEILAGLDIIDSVDRVSLVLEKNGRERTVEVQPVPRTGDFLNADDASPVVMNADASQPLPLYLKNTEANYWFEYLAGEKLVYFQFNSVRDEDSGESIREFSQRLFDFIDANDVEGLVIDVRLNHGGNNFLVKPIIDGVICSDKVNEKGRLFVITGRETFSACQNFCNRLERETAVTFVGEPTASRPNFIGEGNHIDLPYSGLTINASSRYWQDSVSDDYRVWVAPELIAEVSSEDYRNNRDPAMATIRAYLDNRHEHAGSTTSM
jgi:tetratricopeptide (TPR) repeat protein